MTLTNDKQNRKREERRQFAREYLGGKCRSCGSTEKLHFDHVNLGTKTYNISQCLTSSKVLLVAELDKCQLLCPPCHMKKTIHERVGNEHHGRYTYYKNHKCRCEACTADNAAYHKNYMRRYRAMKKNQPIVH